MTEAENAVDVVEQPKQVATMGVKERIQRAKTEAEMTALLEEGSKFDMASPATQRAWKRAAQVALNRINKVVVNPTPVSSDAPVAEVPKKKKQYNRKKKS